MDQVKTDQFMNLCIEVKDLCSDESISFWKGGK